MDWCLYSTLPTLKLWVWTFTNHLFLCWGTYAVWKNHYSMRVPPHTGFRCEVIETQASAVIPTHRSYPSMIFERTNITSKECFRRWNLGLCFYCGAKGHFCDSCQVQLGNSGLTHMKGGVLDPLTSPSQSNLWLWSFTPIPIFTHFQPTSILGMLATSWTAEQWHP